MLSKRAHLEKTGARGLLSVFEKALIKFEKTLPSTNIKKLHMNEEVIINPEAILHKMLSEVLQEDVKNFQKDFLLKHGVYLDFDENAVQEIKKILAKAGKSITQLCRDLFHDYHYGAKLVESDTIKITKEAVENPNEYLNKFIGKNYKEKKKGSPKEDAGETRQ